MTNAGPISPKFHNVAEPKAEAAPPQESAASFLAAPDGRRENAPQA